MWLGSFYTGNQQAVSCQTSAFKRQKAAEKKCSGKKAIPVSEEKGFFGMPGFQRQILTLFCNTCQMTLIWQRWGHSITPSDQWGRLALQTEETSGVQHSSPPALGALCLTIKSMSEAVWTWTLCHGQSKAESQAENHSWSLSYYKYQQRT